MQCPTCRRRLDTTDPVCPRCGTDLATLHAVTSAARHRMSDAGQALAARRPHDAINAYHQVQNLQHSAEVDRGLAIAHLCARDFPNALLAYAQFHTTMKK